MRIPFPPLKKEEVLAEYYLSVPLPAYNMSSMKQALSLLKCHHKIPGITNLKPPHLYDSVIKNILELEKALSPVLDPILQKLPEEYSYLYMNSYDAQWVADYDYSNYYCRGFKNKLDKPITSPPPTEHTLIIKGREDLIFTVLKQIEEKNIAVVRPEMRKFAASFSGAKKASSTVKEMLVSIAIFSNLLRRSYYPTRQEVLYNFYNVRSGYGKEELKLNKYNSDEALKEMLLDIIMTYKDLHRDNKLYLRLRDAQYIIVTSPSFRRNITSPVLPAVS
jgi:hypothetical protein